MVKRNAAFHQRHTALAQLFGRQPSRRVKVDQRIINTRQRRVERPVPHQAGHLLEGVLGNHGQAIGRHFRLTDGDCGQHRNLFNFAPRAVRDQFLTRAKPRNQCAGHLVFQTFKSLEFWHSRPACGGRQYRLTQAQLPGYGGGFLIREPFKGDSLWRGCRL